MAASPLSRIERASGDTLAAANAIYRELRFDPSDPGRDQTWCILADGTPVALGRTRRHSATCYEIGGFWTDPAHRGRGLAGRLVRHAMDAVPEGATGWCIPFLHLVEYYRAFGMEEPGEDVVVPPGIGERCTQCREDGHRTGLLRFGATPVE